LKIIWALLDDRAGNVSQVLGLANATGLKFEEKHIKYNLFAKLPNFIRGNSLIGLANKEIIQLPYPDLVIAAGRRSAPIALHIKKKSPSSKIIHIMSPDCPRDDFDLIILPEHDMTKPASNVENIIGSLHRVTDDALLKSAKNWKETFSHLKHPYISLIIGGSSKNGIFDLNHARELGIMSNEMALNLSASLLISTSRRTSEEALEVLMAQITVPNYLYSYGSKGDNPYLAYLALSDYIIVTGDSVSMISEACFTGKPVFIYSPYNITGKKHKYFHSSLIDKNYATYLSNNETSYMFKPEARLDELKSKNILISLNNLISS